MNICLLDDATGLCVGCGQSVEEIAGWSAMSDKERQDIVASLAGRTARRDESER